MSVPTIYRHFGTKAELLAAVYPHAARKAGLDTIADPRTMDELQPMIRALVERLDSLDDLSRAAMASPAASEVRHATMPARLQRIRRLTDSIEPKLTEADQDRITRLHGHPHVLIGVADLARPSSAPPSRKPPMMWTGSFGRRSPRAREEGAMTASALRRLGDLRMADAPDVGGKAALLGELIAAGARVPDGLVLTVAAGGLSADERGSLLKAGVGTLATAPLPSVPAASQRTGRSTPSPACMQRSLTYRSISCPPPLTG